MRKNVKRYMEINLQLVIETTILTHEQGRYRWLLAGEALVLIMQQLIYNFFFAMYQELDQMRLKRASTPNLFLFYEETQLNATTHLLKNPYALFTVAKKQKRFFLALSF